MKKLSTASAGIIGALLLSGCAMRPLTPTVQVTAPPSKSVSAFMQDESECTALARQQVPVSRATNSGSAREVLQKQFDDAYGHCMDARGNIVEGVTPPPPPPPPAPPPPAPAGPHFEPLVAHVQAELIRLGLLSGKADGFFGPRTRGAILDYEKLRGLPRDGAATPALLDDLKRN